jgi:hypothetical protein
VLREFITVHARHLHVGDHEIDLPMECSRQFDGFLPVSGHKDSILGSPESKQEEIPNDDVIFGKEDDGISLCESVVKDLLVILVHAAAGRRSCRPAGAIASESPT